MNAVVEPLEIEAAMKRKMVADCIQAAVELAHDVPGGWDVAGQAMCAALDTFSGPPDMWEASREDAQWWADTAPPAQLEVVVAAGLRAISRKAFAERARKRVFMDLWHGFTPEQQEAFLKKVAPP